MDLGSKLRDSQAARPCYAVEQIQLAMIPSSPDLTAALEGSVTTEPTRRTRRLEDEVVGLFDQLRNRLLRYTLSLGLPIQDGEEVIQEVFLSLSEHLRAGRPRNNLQGWVFRVAHNLALKRRTRDHALQDAPCRDEANAEQHADPSLNPEDQAIWEQRRRRLLAVVGALPERDQLCLRLRAEGLRYREIADVLAISLGAVSISLTRSLARLARANER
jgi:RNA polymerase sigma-70 factor, ECF subfamily